VSFDPGAAADHLRRAGMSHAGAQAKGALFAGCAEAMKSLGISSEERRRLLFVPGRIEFLGKHTDYAGGRSLICAVERGICVIVSPRSDAVVRVIDAPAAGRARDDAPVEFALSPELAPRIGHWSNYPMTVARRVARNFPGELRGADIALASDLPPAAGMSSSSALMIAIFLALDAVNDLRARPEYLANIHSTEDLAGYLGTIENGQTFGTLAGDRGVGTFGGSQDHTAILCGKPGQLSQYGFCPVVHERDVPVPAACVLAVAVSGVVAEKTGEARELYNRASRLVSDLVSLWRQHTGRNDPTLAAAVRSSPDAVELLRESIRHEPSDRRQALLDRLNQFAEESEQIIPTVGDALLRNDLATVSEGVARSQYLTEHLLRNQVTETIDLARLAKESGAIAASAFGAGFGGSVWALVPMGSAKDFLASWRAQYEQAHLARAHNASFFTTRAGPRTTSW
jgi:galactokinase